ncbi:MAG: hypothetical protein QGH45_06880 [Myxococcota bacterium]|nr:hypothetical protein [Myxococcota bacterium]
MKSRSSNASRTTPPRALLWAWPPLLAGLALLANGYRYGTTDQAIHLTFLRELMDPGGMAADLVATRGGAHASLWWHLQTPLVRWIGWENLPHLYLCLYVVALTATFALLVQLARTLLGNPWAALVAPLLLVVFKGCPAHVHTFEPELINRTAVHPLLLGAVWLLLRGRPIRAAALCGLAFDLHATTASHVALALAVATVADPALRPRALRAAGVFLICAAPLLAMVALRGGPGAWWVDEAWMNILRWRMPHHLFPDRWPAAVWLVAGFQLGLWVVASRWVADRTTRRRAHLLIAGVLLCGPLLGTLAAGPLPLAPLLALHLWEAWILLAVLAYLAAGGAVFTLLRGRRWWAMPAGVALGLLLVVGFESTAMGLREPVTFTLGAPGGTAGELVDALDGTRFRVSAGSSLLVPPTGMTWLRAEAGRAIFVSVKDGGEAVFDRELAMDWRRRLEELCGEDLLAGTPPVDEWRGYRAVGERARAAFARQSAEDLRRLAARERAWLLVVPTSSGRTRLTPVYLNDDYFVYDLRHPVSGAGARR